MKYIKISYKNDFKAFKYEFFDYLYYEAIIIIQGVFGKDCVFMDYYISLRFEENNDAVFIIPHSFVEYNNYFKGYFIYGRKYDKINWYLEKAKLI